MVFRGIRSAPMIRLSVREYKALGWQEFCTDLLLVCLHLFTGPLKESFDLGRKEGCGDSQAP